MKLGLAVLAILALAAGAALAQDTYLSRSGLDMYGQPSGSVPSGGSHPLLGFLNTSNLKISNETSFSVLSGGGSSLSQGLNVTHLTYQQGNSPLSLSVGLGNLFMSSGSYLGYSAKPGFFLHDMTLRYQPSQHSIITFQYQRMPGTWNPNYRYLPGYDPNAYLYPR
ncbi:MAG TPA: hypothetical protein VMS93_05370 [Candidatus Saccharimonadales bacterium]|nr:hypothetical protein [Candidatus Saccharimonadales bacterium]